MTQTHVPLRAYGFGLRSASVGAERMSTGHPAPRPGYFAVMPQLVMGRERPSEARSPRRGKTGDPRKRTGGSSPSHSAMETWLNWQKHFPAKEGPGGPACGIETHCLRLDVAYEHHPEILYRKFNDKPGFP